MSLVKVKNKFQITIPTKVRNEMHIKEGDFLEIKAKGETIVIKPKALVDRGSTLSPKGEKKVREALEDVKKGRVKKFDNIKDLIKDLDS
ncbi:MAG: AbrB/MazE/SpoVT family DNA-binding domain-containing protein [Planctomycetes bacterium]|nr:AbrB/MazE/SpoVT family DNA-binding domain-containing protein [Planctomycetota bacterium]